MASQADSGQSLIECVFVLLFSITFFAAIVIAQGSYQRHTKKYQFTKETWRFHDPQKANSEKQNR